MENEHTRERIKLKTIEGNDFIIECVVYIHQNGWGHRATIVYNGENYINYSKRITYYNRTWERFKYESVLLKVIEEYYYKKADEGKREYLLNQIRNESFERKWLGWVN